MLRFALALAAAGQAGIPPVLQDGYFRDGGGRAWIMPWRLPDPHAPTPTITQRDATREVARLQEAARHGNVEAMRLIGFLLLFKPAPDQSAALGWFYEAALRGDPPSMLVLGCVFQQGVGVKADVNLSAFWLDSASKHGIKAECR